MSLISCHANVRVDSLILSASLDSSLCPYFCVSVIFLWMVSYWYTVQTVMFLLYISCSPCFYFSKAAIFLVQIDCLFSEGVICWGQGGYGLHISGGFIGFFLLHPVCLVHSKFPILMWPWKCLPGIPLVFLWIGILGCICGWWWSLFWSCPIFSILMISSYIFYISNLICMFLRWGCMRLVCFFVWGRGLTQMMYSLWHYLFSQRLLQSYDWCPILILAICHYLIGPPGLLLHIHCRGAL